MNDRDHRALTLSVIRGRRIRPMAYAMVAAVIVLGTVAARVSACGAGVALDTAKAHKSHETRDFCILAC